MDITIHIPPALHDRIIETSGDSDPRHSVEIVAAIRQLLDDARNDTHDHHHDQPADDHRIFWDDPVQRRGFASSAGHPRPPRDTDDNNVPDVAGRDLLPPDYNPSAERARRRNWSEWLTDHGIPADDYTP